MGSSKMERERFMAGSITKGHVFRSQLFIMSQKGRHPTDRRCPEIVHQENLLAWEDGLLGPVTIPPSLFSRKASGTVQNNLCVEDARGNSTEPDNRGKQDQIHLNPPKWQTVCRPINFQIVLDSCVIPPRGKS